jgi:hypothetical protein
VFDAELEWDNNFPPDALALFEQAKAELLAATPVEVSLLPIPSEGTAWIDGKPLRTVEGKIEVYPGDHLLQFSTPQIYTVALYVTSDSEPTVMLPSLLSNQAISWVNDTEKREDLGVLLAAILEDQTEVYVSTGGEVWRLRPVDLSWEQLKVPSGFFIADQDNIGKFYASQALFWTGAASIATGGIFGMASVSKAREAQRAHDAAEGWTEQELAKTRYTLAAANANAGVGIFAAGVTLAGVSFVVQLETKPRIMPSLRPGGGGLLLDVPLR